jgi:ubiquitin-conjugating enzyme E2 J2
MSARSQKVLMHQYTIAKKEVDKLNSDPNGKAHLIPYIDNNIYLWYFLIQKLDAPYLGGEYIFKLTAPSNFPDNPPSFEFITPNGVYDLGGKICISVGEYHTNDHHKSGGSYGWRPSLGMMGFAREVLNGFVNYEFLDHGIRIIKTSIAEKNNFAKKSIEYNMNYHMDIYSNFIIDRMPDAPQQEQDRKSKWINPIFEALFANY